jgi:imidazolonepropionase
MDPSLGEGELGRLDDVTVVLSGARVLFIGPDAEAPAARQELDATGCLLMPGLVDCHTHAVWAGSRGKEFRRRLAGVPYSQILEEGGGILSTVEATRSAGEPTLTELAVDRLQRLQARGVTTVEIKSGYGLEPATERLLLQVAKEAGRRVGLKVFTTFLGAHAIPQAFRSNREAYVAQVLEEQLPIVAPYADFIDAYIDRGAFTVDEGERILRAGSGLGLGVRVHAEQVTHTGAAAMAARLGALSADHLEQIDAEGIDAMAKAGTIAVLLPGAQAYLKDAPPPVGALREAGVPLAVATDLNPGSSPVLDPWIAATLACISMGLTVEEALLGMTARGADALGDSVRGRVRVGGPADVLVVAPPRGEPVEPEGLVQYLGGTRVRHVIAEGRLVD